MKKILFGSFLLVLLASCSTVKPTQKLSGTLLSGPMLGYADMKEVLIWAQTTGPAEVFVRYWVKGSPETTWQSDAVTTRKEDGFTAKLIPDQLEPGTEYEYRVVVNGQAAERPYPTTFKTQQLWQWRTDPPAFAVATGSCAYINETQYDRPGKPYGSNYQIFTHITEQKPDVMVWLGDNVYYREPDWNTRTGMLHRYTHDRALPELQPLLAAANHYAIWDDHDFGPNDSDGSWIHKETAWEVFKDFWGNPSYGAPGQKGCATYFKYNDIDFFLLDNRYYRTANDCSTCPRTALGAEQLEWFKQALAGSSAPFKVVAIGGQMLTDNDNNETYAHFYGAERDSILSFIEKEDITGVIFLTGDRHFTEFSQLKNKKGHLIYDLTTSPFTSGVYANAAKETNSLRVDGTLVVKHNFSMLRFSGPRTARQLQISVYDFEGKEMWTRTLNAKD